MQKNAKFSSAGGSAIRPHASGGWGLCPNLRLILYVPDKLVARHVARNSQWGGAVLGVWGWSPQPPEANGELGEKPPVASGWGSRGKPPSTGSWKLPPCAGSWALSPQTPNGLRRLGGPPPDPQNSPPIANFWLRAWPQAYRAHTKSVVNYTQLYFIY